MKQCFLLSFIIVMMVACQKDKPETVPPALSVDQTTLQFSPSGETLSLQVQSNITWKLTVPDWLAADMANGSGNATVHLLAEQNPGTAGRDGTIKIEPAGTEDIPALTINVIQDSHGFVVDWQRTEIRNEASDCYGMVSTPDGSYYYIIEQYYDPSLKIVLRKVNSSGTTIWSSSYDNCWLSNTGCITATESGVAFIARYQSEQKVKVVNVNSAGNTEWTTELQNVDFDKGLDIIAAQNKLLALGIKGNNLYAYTINLNGTIQDQKVSIDFGDHFINDAGVSPTGDICLTGTIDNNAFVCSINSTGQVLWRKLVSSAALQDGAALNVLSDGAVIATGHYQSSPVNTDIWVAKYSTIGDQKWFKFIGGQTDETVTAVLATQNGILLGGGKYLLPDFNIWLVELDNNGVKKWDQLFPGMTLGGKSNAFLASSGNGFFAAGTAVPNLWHAKFNRN